MNNTKHLNHDQMRQLFAEGKRKMMRKLLFIGYEMGYDKAHNPTEERMSRSDVNLKHVNAWLMSEKSSVKKPMNEMTHAELVKVLTQFELVYNDFKKRI